MHLSVILLIVSISVITPPLIETCKSKPAPREERTPTPVVTVPSDKFEDEGDDDETPDEDDEDIDIEDFDFICDNYQAPIREKRLPGVVVIGARKGGTRALLEFLKLHPMLKSSGPEIHFFDKPQKYTKGVSWYLDQMPILEQDQVAMEKTPGYFHTPGVPARMKSIIPDAKFLLIVRDPVKRLISDYNQFRSYHLAKGETYPELEEFLFNKSGDIDIKYPPLRRSIYHLHLGRWYDVFSKSAIHIVNGDEFIKKPWEELQRVEKFLDIYPHIGERNFYFNETKGFFCARDIRSKGIWECSRNKCLSKSKGRPKPPVKPHTLSTLKKYFRNHNKIFEQMINRTFNWDD